MSFFRNLKYVTSFDPKGTRNVIFLEILHSLFLAAPSAALLLVLWELFSATPDVAKVWTIITAMLVALVLQAFVAGKSMITSNIWVYTIGMKLRIEIGNRMQRFTLGFFKTRDPGDVAGVALQDVNNFEGIFGHSFGNLTQSIFTTTFLGIFLLVLDWRLALCLLLAIPLVYPFLYLGTSFVEKYGKNHIQARNTVSSRFLEYIQGIRHLKSYGQVGVNNQILIDAFENLRKKSLQVEMIPGAFIVFGIVIMELGFLGMLWIGMYFFTGGTLSIEIFLAFLILGYNLYGPLKVSMVDYPTLKYMNESLIRVMDILEHPLPSEGNEIPKKYDIAFKNVSFGYTEQKIFSNLSFRVPEYSMTALIGPSGSGKTTITSLVARFWDVQEGSVTIGGVDVKNIPQNHLYSLISEVFQDVYLFDDTIYNNIKVGKPTASEKEILAAAEKAQVLVFAEDFPDGIHTKVGEGGGKLSGGQKQRISIARALLKDAPIVLLDEATASLDPENEFSIQQAIQALVASKTLIVIAHKLATIRQADQILVLSDGKIVERGNHDELLKKEQVYRRMIETQERAGGWKIGHTIS